MYELSINQSIFIMIKITLISNALNASFQPSHFDYIIKAFTLDFLAVIAVMSKIMTHEQTKDVIRVYYNQIYCPNRLLVIAVMRKVMICSIKNG